MSKAFFISGTGTDIGKTVVTCSLIRQLKQAGRDVAAIKPVISGWHENDINMDTLQILASQGLPHSQENIDKISPLRFSAPLAPSMAARREGTIIDYNALLEFCKAAKDRNEYLFCEGVGGVAVPLNERKTTLDLMVDLQFPVLLVAGTYLGSISHAITAVKTMENMGIVIQAIIVNESMQSIGINEAISELQNFINYPIWPLGRVKDSYGFEWKYTANILNAIS